MLDRRARTESDQLRDILATQRAAIIAEIERRADAQLTLDFDAREREQWEQEKRWLDDRLVSIQRELESEPAQIAALYDVALVRLEPVGLVVLWPETRA